MPILGRQPDSHWSAPRPSCGGTALAIGLVEPDEFIPILEQTGQIKRGRTLGCCFQACAQMSSWREGQTH